LDGLQGASSVLNTPASHIIQTFGGLVDQQQVNVFTLQLVVVVQALGVDDGDEGLTGFGDDFFSTARSTATAGSKGLGC